MKTSIIKLSVNECLYVNGGVRAEPFINNLEIHSIEKALVSDYSKHVGIGAVSVGGLALVALSITRFICGMKVDAAMRMLSSATL